MRSRGTSCGVQRGPVRGPMRGPVRGPVRGLCWALALGGCALFDPASSPVPQARPQVPAAPETPVRSPESQALARYYQALENDLLTRGLLRRDGGGPDTEFTPDDLVRNFETLAFFDEYSRGFSAGVRDPGESGLLSRWAGPVRIIAEFGASVAPAQRDKDQAAISGYAARLGRITGHPISSVRSNGNFYVFVAGQDDRDFVRTRLKQVIPGISPSDLDLFANLPKSFYCLILAASNVDAANTYMGAVALIRAEHPDLVRLSCIHEEIAQGLGLPNDSPRARPSIFNDDDEFALLTSQDELLLKMLYDPRLKPGMSADQARPVMRVIAAELMGSGL